MGVDLGEGLFIIGTAFGGKGDNGTDDGGTGEVFDGEGAKDVPPAIRSEREGTGLFDILWCVLGCRKRKIVKAIVSF